MSMLRDFFSKFRTPGAKPSVMGRPGAGGQGRAHAQPPAPWEDLAHFRFPASENLISDIGNEKLLRVIKAFAPSQPTQSVAQFAGRLETLSNVVVAIEEHRNHLVLFGGRGTGKTSLALALSSVAKRVGYQCAYISCTRESTAESVFRSALAELSIRFDQYFDPRAEDVDPSLTFEALCPEGHLTPQMLTDILSRIRGTRLLVVIDEFDRNENPTLTRDLTEIMKVVSDRAIPVQIVIVGVGDVVDNLVGEHSSIARVLYVVRLSNMSSEQIRDTLAVASKLAGISMQPSVVNAIIGVAYGRPYVARLVGLKAAKFAVLRGSDVVEMQDFESGADELLTYLASAGFSLASQLLQQADINIHLLMAILSCKRDASDRFGVGDVVAALPPSVQGRHQPEAVQRALDIISAPQFGLLHLVSTGPNLYQFNDPRAELSMSIVCSRALRASQSAAPAPRAAPELGSAQG